MSAIVHDFAQARVRANRSKAQVSLPEAHARLYWEGDDRNPPRTGTAVLVDAATMMVRWDGEPSGTPLHPIPRDVIRQRSWRYARPAERVTLTIASPALVQQAIQAARSVGSRYQPGRDLVDIAKDVRADIKAAIAAGTLPSTLKVSVRTSRYSGGESLDLRVTNVHVCILNPERVRWEATNPHEHALHAPAEAQERYTPEGRHILDVLGCIAGAYNAGSFDPDSDRSNLAFHCSADFDGLLMNIQRRAIRSMDPKVRIRNNWTVPPLADIATAVASAVAS